MVVADPTRSGASFRKQASGATAFIYSCWQKNGVRFNTTLAAMTVAEARLEAAEFKARIKRGEDVRATLQAEKAEAKAETAAAKQAAYLETEAGRRKAEAEKRAALDAVFTVADFPAN